MMSAAEASPGPPVHFEKNLLPRDLAAQDDEPDCYTIAILCEHEVRNMSKAVTAADYPDPVVSSDALTVPDLAPLWLAAQARGHSAVAVHCEEKAGRWSAAVYEDADVSVVVEYHGRDRRAESDEMRLDEAWKIPAAGLIIDKMGAPISGTTLALFAAMTPQSKTSFGAFIIDQRGSVGGLASRRLLPGGKIVGAEIRRLIKRYADQRDRNRGFRAREMIAVAGDADLIFDAGAAEHLLNDPFHRGTFGFPLAAWCARWRDDDGTWHSGGNFSQLNPFQPTATAGYAALAIETWNRTNPNLPGSNVWERPLDPTGNVEPPSLHRPIKPSGRPATPDPNRASAVTVRRVAQRTVTARSGPCSSCAAEAVLNDDHLCRKCWKSDAVAYQRLREAKDPSPGYDPVRRGPDDHELKPHPDDPRRWLDPTLAAVLGPEVGLGEAAVRAALAAGAVTEQEAAIFSGELDGLTQTEIGASFVLDQPVVSRLRLAAIKKIQDFLANRA